MASGDKLAFGAPRLFGSGEGEALGVGVSAGNGDGVSVGDGLGDDFFLRFGEVECESDSSSAGVGEAFFFFRGEALADGVGDSFGAALFFLCGVGVGVEKISLMRSPIVWAGAGDETLNAMSRTRTRDSVIPSDVEGSWRTSLKVTPRDPSAALRFARDDTVGEVYSKEP